MSHERKRPVDAVTHVDSDGISTVRLPYTQPALIALPELRDLTMGPTTGVGESGGGEAGFNIHNP